jgi:hypothetical protein
MIKKSGIIKILLCQTFLWNDELIFADCHKGVVHVLHDILKLFTITTDIKHYCFQLVFDDHKY